MRKKLKIKLILLIIPVMILCCSSIITPTVAQESINITGRGCSVCSQENNRYWVNWTYTGTIPFVSIYIYNLSYTFIEYTVVENTMNLGTYEWNMPASHTLDGDYRLVVCDASNHNVNGTFAIEVYPIYVISTNIPGFPILSIGVIIGVTSVIFLIPLAKKLRKR